MRTTVQKMLKRYFTGIWIFSSIIVLLSFHLTHEQLTGSDYRVIASIVAGIGIGLWHTAHEVWEFMENIEAKKRKRGVQ